MPHSQKPATFEEHNRIHSYLHVAKGYYMLSKKATRDPNLGLIPAAIYSVLLDHYEWLTNDPNTERYKETERNGGWFYKYQTQIADDLQLSQSTIQREMQKLIGTLLLEQKRTLNGRSVSYYQFIAEPVINNPQILLSPNPDRVSPNPDRVINTITNKYNNNKSSFTRTRVDRKDTSQINNSADIDPKFIALAAEWEPKISKSSITDNQILRAAKTLQKLVVEFGYSFKELQLGIEWAYNDTIPEKNGFCWSKNFRTLTGLCQRNTNSKSNTEDIKFEKIHNARLRSIENSPEEIFNQRIEAIIRKFWNQPGEERHVTRCLNDIDWFQDKLEQINRGRIARHKFTWHQSEKFIEIVKWLMGLEEDSPKTFRAILTAYLEFLQYKLQDGTVQTLYPGYFSNTSELFRQYLAEDYNVTGRKLVDWQKGDFDE